MSTVNTPIKRIITLIQPYLMKHIFITFLFLVVSITSHAAGPGRIRIVFRYDDYTLEQSPLNDTLLAVFSRNKIPLTIGIIPFDEKGKLINEFDSSMIDDLKTRIRNREIEVALHGYNHQNIVQKTRFKRKYYSEFATAGYKAQYAKIKKGLDALDSLLDIHIETFIPPFDTYDNNTLNALTDLGVKTISASIFGATSCVSGNEKIMYMPATIANFDELQSLLSRYKDENVTIILYFHPYTFRGESISYSDEYDISRQITLTQLDKLLQQVKSQDIDFYTFSTLSQKDNFDRRLYVANYYKDNLVKDVLYKFKKYRYGIYSTLDYHADHKGLMIWNLLLHAGIFLVVFLVVLGLLKIFKPGKILVTLILIVMVLLAMVILHYFIDDSSFKMKLIFLMVVFAATISGVICGLEGVLFRRKTGLFKNR